MPRVSKYYRSRLANLKKAECLAQQPNEDQGDSGTGVSDQSEQSAGASAARAPEPAATSGADSGPPPPVAAESTSPVGRRIIDIGALTGGIDTLLTHTKNCWQPSFVGERRTGLEVFLCYKCHKCGTDFHVARHGNDSLNSQAVYAAVTTGSGYSAMEAQLAVMDIPFMTFKQFSELQEDVGEVSTYFLIFVTHSICTHL